MKIRKELQKELARRDYSYYVEYVHHGIYTHGKHTRLICKEVQDLIDGVSDKPYLLLSVPPQHSKSMTITETLPSYYLGRNPGKRVIEASYAQDLANGFGNSNKKKIEEFGLELFDIEVAHDSRSKSDWDIKGTRGGMISRGIMGGITGKPADLIIIDDPIKNRREAESEVFRKALEQEYRDSILSRMSAGCKMIVIQTRWHTDDLIGYIMKNTPDKAKYINIPCEAEENDILGREVGEALFPEIGKDTYWMLSHKQNYMVEEGVRSWNALYQGNPVAKEGNMFKREWIKYYDMLPGAIDYDLFAGMVHMIMSVDATFKNTDDSDFVSIGIWGKRGPDMFLIDRVKEKMDFVTTLDTIKNLLAKYPMLNATLIEDKANGSALISVLSREFNGIVPITPKESKEARAWAITPAFRSGNVYFPRVDWVHDYVEELLAFPNAAHDDDVDMTSQAINELQWFVAEVNEFEFRDDFKRLREQNEQYQETIIENDFLSYGMEEY